MSLALALIVNKNRVGNSGFAVQWVLWAGRAALAGKISARGVDAGRIGAGIGVQLGAASMRSAMVGKWRFCVGWLIGLGLVNLVQLRKGTHFCGFAMVRRLIGHLLPSGRNGAAWGGRVDLAGADRRGGQAPFGPPAANSTPVASAGRRDAKKVYPGPCGSITGDIPPLSPWQLVPAIAERREVQWSQTGSGVRAARVLSVKRHALRRPQRVLRAVSKEIASFIGGLQRGWSCLLSVKLGVTLCRVLSHVN